MYNNILFSLLHSKMNYLDPGSGSLIIQMVIAAVLGVGVFIRVFWKNIKGFFTGKKVSEDSVEDPTAIIVEDHTAIVDADSTTLAPDDPAATMDDDPTAFSPDSI